LNEVPVVAICHARLAVDARVVTPKLVGADSATSPPILTEDEGIVAEVENTVNEYEPPGTPV
jgi:hypothetical protein